MSAEAQKPVVPVEEPAVAPVEKDIAAPVESSTTATETKPVEAPAAVAESTEPVTTEGEVAPVKEPQAPIEEGILGYKGDGLLKSLFFSKKHFWFGTEPVEQKNLASYLRGEKQDVANHNAAWASHTGKGLLFFSKKSTEKLTPAHIFNLADVTNITEDGPLEFHFTQGGHKHTFQAASLNERENWVSTLKTKVEEAKTIGATIKDTEEYKSTHTALATPVVAAASTSSAPKKSTDIKDKVEAVKEEKKAEHEAKKEEKAEEKAEKAEKKEELKEEKKDRTKSRSASRKRASIFGSLPGFGKKEDKTAEVKQEAAKEETIAPTTDSAAPVAPVSEPVVAPVVPTETSTAPVTSEPIPAATETTVAADKTEPRPTANKRNSIFDSFRSFGKKPAAEEKKEEAPVVPAKEKTPEPVSETAPVIPAVESSEPLSTSVASPTTAPTQETPVAATETKAVETPAVKSDKRKASLPFLGKKKEVSSSDEETEATEKRRTTSPFAKLRATIKGKKESTKEKEAAKEKTPEPVPTSEPVVESEPIVKKEETAPIVEEPVKKDAPVAATPQVAASA